MVLFLGRSVAKNGHGDIFMDKAKLGASTACLAGYSLLDAVAKIKELGFQTIELLAFAGARHSVGDLAGFYFNRMSESEKRDLRKGLEGFKHVAAHLPFLDIPLFSHNPEVAEFCRRHLKMSIEGSAYFGATAAAIHVYPRGGYFKLAEYWGEMISTLRDLGDHAAKHGVRLGIETGYPNTIQDFTKLVLDIAHPHVGALIDVGHCFFYQDVIRKSDERGTSEAVKRGNDCIIKIVETLGPKNYHFHLHDFRQKDWRDHRGIGRGVIDFPRLFQALKKIGYAGLLTFELEEQDLLDALRESRGAIEALM
jgi:sugar phosphate isomerase/epimerase